MPFVLGMQAAYGQEADAAMPETVAPAGKSGSPALPDKIEQVIITAEKRSVNIQNAPLSVTAISGENLQKSNITALNGLNGQVPGMSIAKSSGYETVVTMRGVGSETPESAYATAPGVSLHVDGVYIANSISLDQSLFDLDRIEVLRGPQGTLFGQSSTGGTINLISKQPELNDFGGSADLSAGNYKLRQGRVALNIPIGETVAVRGSAQKNDHDGFARSTYGFGLDELHDASGKLAMMWKPNADFSAILTGQWYRANQNGAEQKNILDPEPDPRTVTQDYASTFKLAADLYHLNLVYNLPWATFKSITSYQTLDHKQHMNGARLDFATLGVYDDVAAWNTKLQNFTQEFDLQSQPGGKVDWVTGLFIMKQRSNQYVLEYSGKDLAREHIVPADNATSLPANLKYAENTTVHRTSWAPFFQTTYHVTDHLRLTGGARYNSDATKGDRGTYFNLYGPPGKINYSSGKPTGKLAIDYDLLPQSMIYANVTRGYKPGGDNANSDPLMVPRAFKPETITAYELGSKNRFLDNTLRLNFSAFLNDYRNMQYLAVDPVPYQGGIGNIPRTRIYGLEAEASWLTLANRLRMNANLTVMRGLVVGDYKTLDAAGVANAVAATPICAGYYGFPGPSRACEAAIAAQASNVKGNSTPKTPKYQGSINGSYKFLSEHGVLTSRAEYVYRGAFVYRVFNNGALDHVASYGLVNLNFDYQPNDSNVRYSVAVSNLRNKAGINSRYTDPYGIGQTSNEYIAPRQVIATIGYSF
ncbi:iron complex outermembrane recepter protein [Pseudoduganella namucuonensis]|uniref:Iron complex outermembrane recepter protein n=1 Tax=Pseudoduganella namucuonensis TaxID=1035707 RepID=A0A1I7IM37_9BURK|nr:iron complex outermembrane recepter protein [Pseudoduganella namucuonensis]